MPDQDQNAPKTDRIPAWVRSVGLYFKEPLRPRDILFGVFAGLGVFLLVQAPFFIAQIRFYVDKGWLEPTAFPKDEQGIAVGEANSLSIPSIGVNAPLVYTEKNDEASIQAALRSGVVHYASTARPGEPGNAYFVGHSSDLPWSQGEYKTVFALLPRLVEGQRFYIRNENGELLTFKVIGTRVVAPTDLTVLDQRNGERRLVTLQTSYPLGTALKRFIVIGELEPKPSGVE